MVQPNVAAACSPPLVGAPGAGSMGATLWQIDVYCYAAVPGTGRIGCKDRHCHQCTLTPPPTCAILNRTSTHTCARFVHPIHAMLGTPPSTLHLPLHSSHGGSDSTKQATTPPLAPRTACAACRTSTSSSDGRIELVRCVIASHPVSVNKPRFATAAECGCRDRPIPGGC